MTSLIEKHMLCWVQCAVEHYILEHVQEGEQLNHEAARSWTGLSRQKLSYPQIILG